MLEKANNFVLYYGHGRAEELSHYDIAIVEPAGQSTEDIKRMQDSNTMVLAYISVMEIAEHAADFKLLEEKDFLHTNNTILCNRLYGTYFIDLRSNRWQRILLQKINNLFSAGYDGLFIDTIGDIEDPMILSTTKDELIMAAINFLRKIRDSYSDHILIQNNGLEKLCLYTASILDGICWENPPVDRKDNKNWVKEINNRLQELQKDLNIKVFILFEEDMRIDISKEEKQAKERGFLFYQAVKGYVKDIR